MGRKSELISLFSVGPRDRHHDYTQLREYHHHVNHGLQPDILLSPDDVMTLLEVMDVYYSIIQEYLTLWHLRQPCLCNIVYKNILIF